MTYTKETLDKFEEPRGKDPPDDWKGFGYLGGFGWRSQETDEILIAAANEAGITEEEFFQFCNSKSGRKLDQIFEGKDVDGKFEPYWPIRECKACGIWQSRAKGAICSDCGLPMAFKKGPHADLHGELVRFLPEICKELMEELAL